MVDDGAEIPVVYLYNVHYIWGMMRRVLLLLKKSNRMEGICLGVWHALVMVCVVLAHDHLCMYFDCAMNIFYGSVQTNCA